MTEQKKEATETVARVKNQILYYRLAYRWARSMGFDPVRSVLLAHEGWLKQIWVPIPGPAPQEAIDLGRELARKYGW